MRGANLDELLARIEAMEARSLRSSTLEARIVEMVLSIQQESVRDAAITAIAQAVPLDAGPPGEPTTEFELGHAA